MRVHPTRRTFRGFAVSFVGLYSMTVVLSVLPANGQSGIVSQSKLEIVWIDRGINNYTMGHTVGSLIPGQQPILVPMPGQEMMPGRNSAETHYADSKKNLSILNPYAAQYGLGAVLPDAQSVLVPTFGEQSSPQKDQEWRSFGKSMEGFFKAKLQNAISSGVNQIEILTQQNINDIEYFLAEQRQDDVTRYTKEIGHALLTARDSLLEQGADVSVSGFFGSNGGRAISEVVPELSSDYGHLFDRLNYIDARANQAIVEQGCSYLPNGCTIINTKNDIKSIENSLVDAVISSNAEGTRLIADPSFAKEIAGLKIQVLDVDVGLKQSFINKLVGDTDSHISPIKDVYSSDLIEVRVYNKAGIPYSRMMTRAELIASLRAALPPGQSAVPGSTQDALRPDQPRQNPNRVDSSRPVPGGDTSLPENWKFDPPSFSAAERAAWERNQEIVRRETIERSRQDRKLKSGVDRVSGSSEMSYPTYAHHSPDGKLTATTEWNFEDALGVWPKATARTAVLYEGKLVAKYDGYAGVVALLSDGKYQVSSPSVKNRSLPYEQDVRTITFDARAEIQNQDFLRNNRQKLRELGYSDTRPVGNNIYAADTGFGWDLIDSNLKKIAPEQYRQVVPLGGDIVAVSIDSPNFMRNGWSVFDGSGKKIGTYRHVKPLGQGFFAASNDERPQSQARWDVVDVGGQRIGDGAYAEVQLVNGALAVQKRSGGSVEVLSVPQATQHAVAVSAPGSTSVNPQASLAKKNPRNGIDLGEDQHLRKGHGLKQKLDARRQNADRP
jgi:hypothetical protein